MARSRAEKKRLRSRQNDRPMYLATAIRRTIGAVTAYRGSQSRKSGCNAHTTMPFRPFNQAASPQLLMMEAMFRSKVRSHRPTADHVFKLHVVGSICKRSVTGSHFLLTGLPIDRLHEARLVIEVHGSD